jgi:hypothetical protein
VSIASGVRGSEEAALLTPSLGGSCGTTPQKGHVALCPSMPATTATIGWLELSRDLESPSLVAALSIHADCGCVLSISHVYSGKIYPSLRYLETKDLYLTARCVLHQDTIQLQSLALALVLPGPTAAESHPSSSTPRSVSHMP